MSVVFIHSTIIHDIEHTFNIDDRVNKQVWRNNHNGNIVCERRRISSHLRCMCSNFVSIHRFASYFEHILCMIEWLQQ